MMNDLGIFSDVDFEPKTWVNALCSSCPASEAIERYLAEAEMRLQLAAEEIEAGLQDSSAQAMRRIPFAVQEIYRLQGDIQGMRDHVKVVASEVSTQATQAASSVAVISQLDHVKRNMEVACSTLREATELSGLFIKVEEVFASGDLPRVAEMLAVMRRSLTLVGDVPEFKEGRGRLKVLEDRLEGLVEGSLSEALSKPAVVQHQKRSKAGEGKGAEEEQAEEEQQQEEDEYVAALCSLLLAVDRYSTIEELFLDSRMRFVHSLWEEVAGSSASPSTLGLLQWLPTFYSRLLPVLEAEGQYCSRVLPAQHLGLMSSLLQGVLTKVSKGLRDRLSSAQLPVTSLSALTAESAAFGRSVVGIFPEGLGMVERAGILTLVYEPLEEVVSLYPALEASHLSSELSNALAPIKGTTAVQPGAGAQAEGTAERLVNAIPGAVRAAAAAAAASVERCIVFTAGTSLPALYKVLDEALSSWVVQLGQHISVTLAQLESSKKGGESTTQEEELSAVLRLVVQSSQLPGPIFLQKIDGAFRAALTASLPKMTAASAAAIALTSGKGQQSKGGPSLTHPAPMSSSKTVQSSSHGPPLPAWDPITLRLLNNPDAHPQIQKLATNLADARFLALPSTSSQVESLCSMVDGAALNTLLTRVRISLAPLSSFPEWTKGASSSSSAHPSAQLPSFSAYPLPYITAIGEYLMILPQQLEVLIGEDGEGGEKEGAGGGLAMASQQDELAGQWLDRVVSGAAIAYSECISSIPQLTSQGGVQLAADVEYFCNVMSALQVMPPLSLLAVQLYGGLPSDQLLDALQGAIAEGRDDVGAIRAVAHMRGIRE